MTNNHHAEQRVVISAPNFQTAEFLIRGTAPYVQNRFSAKARLIIRETQEKGKRNTGRQKEPKDFQAAYEQSMHVSADGWYGIPAPAFRRGMISACRLANFKMTLAKLSVFVEADGYDADEGAPLVRITKGAPRYHEGMVRVANGNPDIRVRGMWEPGWEAKVRVRFDADQFSVQDVANLLMRVGMQVGIGEGRPDTTTSDGAGMGWGTFEVVGR